MKRFSFLVILRVTLMLVNALLFGWIFGDLRLLFSQIILGIVLVVQAVELIHFVSYTNRELSRLFQAILHSDFSVSFTSQRLGSSFRLLEDSFTGIIQAYRQVKSEKEAQYLFLQMLVKQIHIGIVSIENQNIALINPIAEKLLNISGVKNWRLVEQLNPGVAKQLAEIGDNGRKLIEMTLPSETKIVSVEVSSMTILDKPHRLITLQDINSEIEQKEIEAWHKLIRILTHEIMNSVTPISSLTETMQGMLTDTAGNPKPVSEISNETIRDIRFSLQTITKRSDGLLDFVEDYRKLSRVPKPVMQNINAMTLLQNVENLMKEEIIRHDITLTTHVPDPSLTIRCDPRLVEQVLINLITNSVHAVENQSGKKIEITGLSHESTHIIKVYDNGAGIPEKELREIFVPFFSTKKHGSGIGLSLSKQIMNLHGGTIKVQSVVNTGSTFELHFRK